MLEFRFRGGRGVSWPRDSLGTDGFDTTRTLWVTRVLAIGAFPSRSSNVDSNQAFRAPPPFWLNFALCNPGLLKFDPFLFFVYLLSLCTAKVFLVIVAEVVAEMVLASEWLFVFTSLTPVIITW